MRDISNHKSVQALHKAVAGKYVEIPQRTTVSTSKGTGNDEGGCNKKSPVRTPQVKGKSQSQYAEEQQVLLPPQPT